MDVYNIAKPDNGYDDQFRVCVFVPQLKIVKKQLAIHGMHDTMKQTRTE